MKILIVLGLILLLFYLLLKTRPKKRKKILNSSDTKTDCDSTTTKYTDSGVYFMDLVGFFSIGQYSSDANFCVLCSEIKKQLAVVKGRKLLFKKKVERPNDCHISNNGISICCDWLSPLKLEGLFLILDKKGQIIFSKKTTANLGKCNISDDGKIAIFRTHSSNTEDSNKMFVIDVEKAVIISKFNCPKSFSETVIDTNKSLIRLITYENLVFEIDFMGNNTNKEEYESQMKKTGSIHSRIWFYNEKADGEKFRDKRYLETLYQAVEDEEARHSFGLDKLYRMIGEYYECNNELEKTIDYWERAIKINPKVGIKMRLKKLKKNYVSPS